jgi:hypothetical protein
MTSRRRRADLYLILLAVLPFVFFSGALSTRYLISGEDALTFNLPPRVQQSQLLRSLQIPLWDEYSYAGFPLFGDPQNSAAYPPTVVLFLLLPPVLAFNVHVIVHHALAGVFVYLFARTLRLRRLAALLAALSFMFCGYLVAHQQHIQNHASVVWLPAVLAGLEMWRRSRRGKWLLFTAASYAMLLLSGYPQIALYSTGIIVLYVAVLWGLRSRKRREVLRGFLPIAAGLALTAFWLLPALETLRLSSRSDFNYYLFCSYKFYPHLLLNFLMPYFYGSSGGSPLFALNYWGDPGTEFYHEEVYIGLAPICFAILAVFMRVRARHQKRFWILVAVVSLVLSLRMDNVLTQALYHVPVYDKMRGHGRHIVHFCFALSMLAGLGLNEILRLVRIDPKRLRERARFLSVMSLVLLTGAIVFVFVHRQIFSLLMANPPRSPYTSFAALASPQIILPVTFFLANAIIFLRLQKTRNFSSSLSTLFIVLLLDLFVFARFYATPTNTIERWFKNPHNVAVLRFYQAHQDQEERTYMLFVPPWDINTLPFPRVNQMLRIPMINSYNPLIPADIAHVLRMNHYGWALNAHALALNNNILSLLNVKYIAADAYGRRALEKAMALSAISRSQTQHLEYSQSQEVALRNWEVQPPSTFEGGGIFLAGSSPDKAAVATHAARLKRDRIYRLTFEARFCGSQYKRQYVFVKFHPPATDLDLNADGFFPDVTWGLFETYLYADRDLENAALQFYTQASQPFSIRKVTIQSLPARPLFWGTQKPEEHGEHYVPLYRELGPLGKDRWLYENRNVLPFAFLANRLVTAKDIFDAKAKMFHSTGLFDPSREALIEPGGDKPLPSVGNVTTGTAEIVRREANRITIKTKSAGTSFLVVSNRFDPGWKALVDGARVEIYRANGLIQGVFVPRGEHDVRLIYSPTSLWLGLTISAATAFLLLALCVIAPHMRHKQPMRGSNRNEKLAKVRQLRG